MIRFRHSDMDDLEQKAREARQSGAYGKIMVITDGVFSMDGDITKLPEIVQISERYDLITYVDDAHGSGVLGKGAGTVKHFGLSDRIDFQIGTLSKMRRRRICRRRERVDRIAEGAKPAVPVLDRIASVIIAASIAALDILTDSDELQKKLWDNAAYLRNGLKQLGFDTGHSETQITPCIIGEGKQTQLFSRKLIEEGAYAKAIVFPTVQAGTGRIRNIPTAAHTKDMLDRALAIYEKVKRTVGV